MHITVVGSGYVGLVTGVCLADTGNHVVGVDVDAEKIRALRDGQAPIFEPGLNDLLQSNLKAGRLRFTTDLRDALTHAEVIFVAVGTPAGPDGSADLASIEQVARQIAASLDHDAVLVIKSTVPAGTAERIESWVREETPHKVHVVCNPEFLKEGSAVDDFFRPDRVVIGADDGEAGELIRQLYLPFVRNQRPILMMSRKAAEMTKYAANAYLASRISFINEIANLCDRLGIDVDEVRVGIGADARIGMHFLYPGCGYGGSCFPKDVQALAALSRDVGYSAQLLEAVHAVNERQKDVLFEKMAQRFAGQFRGRAIAIWGAAFKPKTDDIREGPAIHLIDRLLAQGARLRVHDPQALGALRQRFGSRVDCDDDAYGVLSGVDALVVVTEWNEFRSPDFKRIKEQMNQPVIFDGRNLYDPGMMRRLGFEHYPIGRPATTSSM